MYMRFYLNFFMLVAIEFKGRFELFRKFIRFGTLTRPLYEYREKSKNVPYTFPLLTGVPTDLSDYIALIMISTQPQIAPTNHHPLTMQLLIMRRRGRMIIVMLVMLVIVSKGVGRRAEA